MKLKPGMILRCKDTGDRCIIAKIDSMFVHYKDSKNRARGYCQIAYITYEFEVLG